jgi:hypothetical protein
MGNLVIAKPHGEIKFDAMAEQTAPSLLIIDNNSF